MSATKTAPVEPEAAYDGAAEATKTSEELFQWSTYVHVGAGAAECEHGEDGECSQAGHFHCWLCLPNTFQARDIQDRSRAAKARRRRALSQDGSDGQEPSDAYLVMEDQVQSWTLTDETFDALKKVVADRITRAAGAEIVDTLANSDAFEHHARDLEEFRRVAALDPDERDPTEWAELEKTIDDYRIAYEKLMTERYESELAHLHVKTKDDVLEIERRHQRETIIDEHFLHTFYTWAWFTCARRPVKNGYPNLRAFVKPEDMTAAPPEVIEALRLNYRRLESKLVVRGDAAGN